MRQYVPLAIYLAAMATFVGLILLLGATQEKSCGEYIDDLKAATYEQTGRDADEALLESARRTSPACNE